MLGNAICAELLKLRRSNLLLPVIGLPILGVLLGAGNYFVNRAALSMPQWQALWTQVAIFYGYFFYPILLAICAAYLWRVEHTNHNWNPLMTNPVPIRTVFLSKLALLIFIGLAVQLFLMLLYRLTGQVIFRFTDPFPLGMACQWVLFGWLAGIPVSAMQLLLSMWIRSFSIPIGISLGCCILGIGFFAAGAAECFPNSLLIIGVGAADATALSPGTMRAIVLVSALYTLLFCTIATVYLKKKDIVSL